jgi:uncharacterized repeat protein (TIGR04076 family)
MLNPKTDDSFELYDLKVEVFNDGKKPMVCNHKIGDYFLLSGENISFPPGQTFPIYSLASLIAILPAKQRMTSKFDWMSTDSDIACPDPFCGGIFRISRVGKRSFYHHEVTLNTGGVCDEC